MYERKLNLGCGNDLKEGYVNIDLYGNPDVKHDLEDFPYPFNKNTFEEVYASHIIEHLDDTIKVMKELHKICKNKSKIIIKTPHFSHYNALTDITHKRAFSIKSFDGFEDKLFCEGFNFKIINKKINFSKGSFLKIFNPLFNPIINKILMFRFNFYERFFCYILPSEELIFELEVIK